MRSALIALVLSVVVIPAHATTAPPDFILLPVVVSHGRDAAGEFWNTRVSFMYAGDSVVDVWNEANLALRLLQPAERGELTLSTENQPGPGVIIETAYPAAKLLFLQTHVYDESSPETGVVLPGVRIRDLAAGQSVRLIGVPVGASTRTLLRIYDVSMQRDVDVRVRVYDESGSLLVTDVVHLIAPPMRPLQSFPSSPAYAEYRPNVDVTTHSSISMDVEPLTPSELLWAFATTTSRGAVAAVLPAK